jgi:hypothetical protein
MKLNGKYLVICFVLFSCEKRGERKEPINLEGTWQLISGTTIEKGDTTITDYTRASSMIKIINKSHFAFLNHDIAKGKDSTALFVAGGGRYELKENKYTEHLEYCSDRLWEGNKFSFTVSIQNDTLLQTGREKIEGTAVNRINIEKYVRVNDWRGFYSEK